MLYEFLNLSRISEVSADGNMRLTYKHSSRELTDVLVAAIWDSISPSVGVPFSLFNSESHHFIHTEILHKYSRMYPPAPKERVSAVKLLISSSIDACSASSDLI